MEQVEISSVEALWLWLEHHHATSDGVVLVTWKAATPDKYVGRDDVLDALMAFGWIDGRRYKVDDARTGQLITPRKQQAWSKSYKDRVERLRSEGRMRPAGEAVVAQGQASGLWSFYDDVDALIVPEDLAVDLDMGRWEALAPSYRRNVLRWLKTARTSSTRRARLLKVVEATAQERKLPQM